MKGKVIPSQVNSIQILSLHFFHILYFMDFFISIESRRIWVEGGDSFGAGNFATWAYNSVNIGSDRIKNDKIGWPCPSS